MIEEGKDIYKMSPYEFEEEDENLAKKDWTYGIPNIEKDKDKVVKKYGFEYYSYLKPYVAPEWKQKIVVPSKREKLDNKTGDIEVKASQIID